MNDSTDSEEYYAAFAEVRFTTRTDVTQNDSGNPDRATVTNLPVQNRSLILTKQDEVGNTPLSDAKFRLEYVSITNGDEGSKTNSGNKASTTPAVTDCTTNNAGQLVDGKGHTPDISAKGTYTLTEIQAPSYHSTFTTTNTNIATTTTLPMLKFKVGSDNTIQFATSTDTSYIQAAIAGTGLVGTPATGTNMTVTVTNHKTSLTIDKRCDLSNNIKTKNQHDVTGEALKGAELAIYEGVGTSGSPIWTSSGDVNTWTVDRGLLLENTVYTLHEESAPTGYMEAEDLYFCLFGTRGNNMESQVYVWTGSVNPPTTVTPTDLTTSNWSPTRNLDDNDLTMVDEAIIAPVDTRKVLETTVGTTAAYTDLPGAEFTVSVTGGPVLGIAVSGADGHLTWKSLTADALNGTVYNTNGKRITTDTDVKDQRVILQQNAAGYTFKETSAPVHAYNNGGEYHVAITTDNDGMIIIPDGMMAYGGQFLLKETATASGYYLSKEAKDGVILNVDANGSVTMKRRAEYQGKTDPCPASLETRGGLLYLTVKNPKAAAFEFTKRVAGNMGDKSGRFKITMEVYEPDGTTLIDSKDVTLKNGELYSSKDGKRNGDGTSDASCAFGSQAFPVNAVLKIREKAEQDYESVILSSIQNATQLPENPDIKSEVWLSLDMDYTTPASFELTNRKNVTIDVGVTLEQNAPYALIAIAIPAVWLYLRARRRRKGDDDR